MSPTFLSLIIQLLSGAAGSGLLARFVSQLNLGPIGNLVTGALGGVGGGSVLGSLLGGGAAATATGGDLASVLTQIVGGGVGGPILTAIAALVRNAIAGSKPA
jgi:hypothetical protein